jgi:DNA-binding XRE family transcriptional regulator
MIYFLKGGDRIKIGCSSHIRKRISNLQCSNPDKLHLSLVIDGDRNVEHTLHTKFQKDKIRGEWFHYSKDIDNYILTMQRAGKDKKSVYLIELEEKLPNSVLRSIRKRKKLTLRDVGVLLDITPQSVKEAEIREHTGTISINTLRSYAKALGYSVDIVFTPELTAAQRAKITMDLK